MSVIGELLFWRRDGVTLDTVLRHQGDGGLQQIVDGISEAEIRASTDDVLVERITAKSAVSPLIVSFDQGKADVTESVMNVRSVFGEQVRVKGLRATKSFPFSGDADLWHLQTNPFDMNPPRGEVSARHITVGMEVREHEADQAAAYIEDSVKSIKEWLGRQEAQIAPFNASLATRIIRLIQQRRARLGKASDLLKRLQS